jgi:hypothetical protein
VKLFPVLSKFLAANHHLSLPGIGTFYSESEHPDDLDGKRVVILNNVTFSQEKIDAFDEELIEFVSKETGKMKVLALSDLSSQLDDVRQFMNTGKPYFFTGIGTLAKKPDGNFEFFAGKYTHHTDRKKENEISGTGTDFAPHIYIDEPETERRKSTSVLIIIFIILILGAIGAAAWYYLKNKEAVKNQTEDITTNTENLSPSILEKDSNTAVLPDTIANTNTPPNISDTYTYILETVTEPRATKRFNQLKNINWSVELEVIDSVNKRIVMKLPRADADTTRIIDSLSALSGRKVFIAH